MGISTSPRGELCAIVVALVSRVVCAQALVNPGFEPPFNSTSSGTVTGSIAFGWLDNSSWNPANELVYARDDAVKHTGLSSQRITVLSGFAQFTQDFPVVSGRVRASVWVRASPPMFVSLYFRGTDYTVYEATAARISDTWTRLSIEGILPADTGAGLFLNSLGIGTLWLDDADAARAVPATPISIVPPPEPVPAGFFGLHPQHQFESPFLPWPSVAVGVVRSHDAAPKWADIEPAAPVGGVRSFDWTDLDRFVNDAFQRNQRVVYTFYQTPAWCASTQDLDPYGQPGGASRPTSFDHYAGFVTALVQRYRGRITAYEPWNEPDIGFWTGTPEQMAELTRRFVSAVRAADPEAIILTPPTSGGGNNLGAAAWLDRFIAAGGAAGVDALGFHAYTRTPEQALSEIASLRSNLMASPISALPVWNTETGYGFDGTGDSAFAAAHLARTMLANWGAGSRLAAWYAWSEVSLVGPRADAQGGWSTLTPGAEALREIQSWMTGKRMLSMRRDESGVWTAVFAPGTGGWSYVVWCEEGTQGGTAPAGCVARRDLSGLSAPASGLAGVTVTTTPVLFETRIACPADLDLSGSVNTADLTAFLARFGQAVTPNSISERADFNTDGQVNTGDLTYFLGRFGGACP